MNPKLVEKLADPKIIFFIALAALTLLSFPTREKGLILNMVTGEIAKQTVIVKMAPIFVLGDRDERNSKILSPNLKQEVRKAGGQPLTLVAPESEMTRSGVRQKWGFAFWAWIWHDVLSAAVLAFAVPWGMRRFLVKSGQ